VLTQRLLAARGVIVALEKVTHEFEKIYQGTDAAPGLCAKERLLVPKVRVRGWARGATPPRRHTVLCRRVRCATMDHSLVFVT
jgi:hypothetical protein